MFFGIPKESFNTLEPEVRVFLALAHGFVNHVPIVRSDIRDKEFPLQNWVQRRIQTAGLSFEPPGRLKYPDFLLHGHACGFEVKGLAVPGRWVDFDCNSQLPLAEHGGSKVFYIFGRYPKAGDANEYPVHDLVLCAASFLNTETYNANKNQSFHGAGSYGDIKVRDRRMYVCKTPFSLAEGTTDQITLILEGPPQRLPGILTPVGDLERKEAAHLVSGYAFDLQKNTLSTKRVPNPNAGRIHRFTAYKVGAGPHPPVKLNT
jgi:hypothetical protein